MVKPLTLLFICTHNRCRSVIAEVVANQRYGDRVLAYSAGSAPAGEVHPLTLKYLTERGYSVEGLKSQSWDEFAECGVDIAITVCDSAAGEACPLWMGDTQRLHWVCPILPDSMPMRRLFATHFLLLWMHSMQNWLS